MLGNFHPDSLPQNAPARDGEFDPSRSLRISGRRTPGTELPGATTPVIQAESENLPRRVRREGRENRCIYGLVEQVSENSRNIILSGCF